MNEIIEEMQLMEQLMGKNNFPKPTYLYQQGYGKDLKNEIENLRKATNSKQALMFDKLQCASGRKLIESYELLLEKNKPIGQAFEGLVIVDFTGLTFEELPDFVEYLKNHVKKNNYIFTTQLSMENTEEELSMLRNILERHFFVRVIEAKPYSPKEQFGVIMDCFFEYEQSGIDIEVSSEIELLLMEQLEKKEWQSTQAVLFQLKNTVTAAVYEAIMTEKNKRVTIDETFVLKMLGSLEEKQERRRRIGFAVGGFENE